MSHTGCTPSLPPHPPHHETFNILKTNWFVRRIYVDNIFLKIDYKPRAIKKLSDGGIVEYINFFAWVCPIENLEVRITPKILTHPYDFGNLLTEFNALLEKDFDREQLMKWLKSVQPIKNMCNVGYGASDMLSEISNLVASHLVSESTELNSRSLGALSLEIGKSVAHFVKGLSVETINVSERLLRTMHAFLWRADKCMTLGVMDVYPATVFRRSSAYALVSSNQITSEEGEMIEDKEEEETANEEDRGDVHQENGDAINNNEEEEEEEEQEDIQSGDLFSVSDFTFAEVGTAEYYEPSTVLEGISQAIDCMHRGALSSFNVISLLARNSELSVGSLRSIGKLLPVFFVRQSLATVEAFASALQGARNSLDPSSRQARQQLFREPRAADPEDA